MSKGSERPGVPPDEPPPFLGTWPRIYAAVVVYLLTMILLFHLFTREYSP